MSVTASPQAPSAAHIARIYKTHLSGGRATLGDIFGGHIETSSDGAWLTTAEGTRFLNAGGYGVALAGYRHPVVVATFVGSWTSTRWPPACSMNPPPPRRPQPWPP
ncbi:Probable ornithine aminotransferase [Mycobacteroides abscessus]|nr:Probable ornithine aminotransferase [Mycobacteroides abscessus]